jgi:hypothetical protein
MPDTTRTSTSRPDFSAVLQSEIARCSRIGLLPGELAARQRKRSELGTLFELPRVASAGVSLEEQAAELAATVIEAVRRLPGGRLRDLSIALFGVESRHRDLGYDQRRSNAVTLWNPEDSKQDESFTRRQLPIIIRAVAASVLDIATPGPRPRTVTGPAASSPASLAAHAPTINVRRASIRAETWLTGREQRAYQSEWRYRDRATEDGVEYLRHFSKAEGALHVEIEPISDTIASVNYRGVDRDGYNVWLLAFREPLAKSEEAEWRTRRTFDLQAPPAAERWTCVTVSHSWPIPHATFVVNFDTRFVPKTILRFTTPKGTLPRLDGPTKEVRPTADGVARAEFDDLQPWHTHGIYWIVE